MLLTPSKFAVFCSFIRSWVLVGKNAKLNTKAAAHNLSFDHQCKHCEKVIQFFPDFGKFNLKCNSLHKFLH